MGLCIVHTSMLKIIKPNFIQFDYYTTILRFQIAALPSLLAVSSYRKFQEVIITTFAY